MSKRIKSVTAAEAERLALLAEEMGESVQIIGKILRHGYESSSDDGAPSHREFLEKKLGDVKHAIDRLCKSHDLDRDYIERQSERRGSLLAPFLHHQPDT
jgi:hypothetical protein